ncbi:MAG: leucine-rich repeat domain-containing protein [Prevotella sp.]|nr:leucine-rich repeat domain-containing protein [Prevotella sp.]
MKQIYLKSLLLCLFAWVATRVVAYDCEVNGIYYDLYGDNATVTYFRYSFPDYISNYKGNITIPSRITYNGKSYSVTSIEEGAFWYCTGLTSITIPNSVTYMDNAFYNCSGLISMRVEQGNPVYDSRGNCNAIIKTKDNELIAGCKKTVIPNSVMSIGGAAFAGCSGLTSITIPPCVTSIGYGAFEGCSGLISISIPNSVMSIGSGAFSGCI